MIVFMLFIEKEAELAKQNAGQCYPIESKATCMQNIQLVWTKFKKRAIKAPQAGYALGPFKERTSVIL